MSRQASGFKAWVIQRVTAVYIALFVLYAVAQFAVSRAAEMERRYRLMSEAGVRNLAGFNKKVRDAKEAGKTLKDPLFVPDELYPDAEAPDLEHLPYIVVIVD